MYYSQYFDTGIIWSLSSFWDVYDAYWTASDFIYLFTSSYDVLHKCSSQHKHANESLWHQNYNFLAKNSFALRQSSDQPAEVVAIEEPGESQLTNESEEDSYAFAWYEKNQRLIDGILDLISLGYNIATIIESV